MLFKIMRELTASGISIVYISHRLEEIMEIGDHVTILRDGKYVADADVKDIDVPWIVHQMTGGEKSYPERDREVDWSKVENVLEVKNLCLPKAGGGYLVDHLNFELKKGEVLGIYGLMGAGRSEVFECIMGLHPEHTGDIYLEGKKLKIKSVSQQIDNGFALIPEDRQAQGLVQTLDIEKNCSLSAMKRYKKGIFLDHKKEGQKVDEQISDIHIKVADKKLPILSLSGGNQQKVVIGKGLLTEPKILLMDEPSRGIDIGAKTEVFDIINQYAEKGLSIIVISSELQEIVAIADRVIVLSNGLKTGEFYGSEIQQDTLVLASEQGPSPKRGKGELIMAAKTKSGNNQLAMTLLKGRTFIVLIVLLIFFSVAADNFLTANALLTVAKHVALYGILAIGMTYVIITGGIDLSVCSVVGLAGMIAGGLIQQGLTLKMFGVTLYFSVPMVVIITAIIGALLGAINGIVITKFKVAPFIATLGTMYIWRGFANLRSDGGRFLAGRKRRTWEYRI